MTYYIWRRQHLVLFSKLKSRSVWMRDICGHGVAICVTWCGFWKPHVKYHETDSNIHHWPTINKRNNSFIFQQERENKAPFFLLLTSFGCVDVSMHAQGDKRSMRNCGPLSCYCLIGSVPKIFGLILGGSYYYWYYYLLNSFSVFFWLYLYLTLLSFVEINYIVLKNSIVNTK